MSELSDTSAAGLKIRYGLLLGVSSLALLAQAYSAGATAAENEDRNPSVWIELGGQLERLEGGQQQFAPAFVSSLAGLPFTSPLDIQRPSHYANGGDASLSFRPGDSTWTFSASIRYGRSNGGKKLHEQTPNLPLTQICAGPTLCFMVSQLQSLVPPVPNKANFIDATFEQRESHAIADFEAGKDVGLGLFGRESHGVLNFGIRFAQFNSRTTDTLNAIPDRYVPKNVLLYKYNHRYDASASVTRSVSGIGPSLSLTESVPVAGERGQSQFIFDWGVNASVLFGKQKALVHHHTIGRYYREPTFFGSYTFYSHYEKGGDRDSVRSVVVPNVGGFASVSLKFPNAKLSLGYRADFFFGAMDGGIDTRETKNVGFHGPFATISLGLGG